MGPIECTLKYRKIHNQSWNLTYPHQSVFVSFLKKNERTSLFLLLKRKKMEKECTGCGSDVMEEESSDLCLCLDCFNDSMQYIRFSKPSALLNHVLSMSHYLWKLNHQPTPNQCILCFPTIPTTLSTRTFSESCDNCRLQIIKRVMNNIGFRDPHTPLDPTQEIDTAIQFWIIHHSMMIRK